MVVSQAVSMASLNHPPTVQGRRTPAGEQQLVAIDESVIQSWLGRDPTYPPGVELVSRELTQVSIFLAAFSGLYFTVYAVTDATYRQQFFTAITRELELAVNARVAYRRLRDRA